MSRRVLIFDIEIRISPNDPRFENEQAGWDALRCGSGGISAAAVWDSWRNWVYFYDDNEIENLANHLEMADVLIGYNSSNFDVPCIEGILGRKLQIKEHIDILTLIWDSIRARDSFEKFKGYKLNDVVKRCLGQSKLENGANVPKLIEQGRWAKIFNYCSDDVHLTKDLFNYIQREGGIIDANGQFLTLEIPDYIPQLVEGQTK